ncbi:MAG: aminoglycoside phosphotransferase family protein [Acidobacteria bacterium]|nr:aminoglycoside phosphotransferase family protein [Acidobacteriota bacterium]
MTIATEPEQLTAEWLTGVLNNAGIDGRVDDVDISAVGTGQMARSYRVVISGSGDLPDSVVCKVPSDQEVVRALGSAGYRKEVNFYLHLAEAVQTRVPQCHHAEMSEDAQQFVLVLQDMAPATQGDQIAGADAAQINAAAIEMARLHRPTWGGQCAADLSWLEDYDPGQLGFFMPIAHEQFIENLGDRLSSEHREVLSIFTEHAVEWTGSMPSNQAVVHGDFRLDNLLFDADGSVTVVDWQTLTIGAAGCDLAYLLGNSVTTDLRRAIEADVIDRYIEELSIDGYSAADCREDLRYGAFQGPMITMLGAFAATQTERGDDMFVAMAERSCAQIVDYDSLAILS